MARQRNCAVLGVAIAAMLLLYSPLSHAAESAGKVAKTNKPTPPEKARNVETRPHSDPAFAAFFAAKQIDIIAPIATRSTASRTAPARRDETRRVSHSRPAILSRLSRKTSVSWDAQSLAEIAQEIAEAGNLNIILHPDADPDKLITLTANNMSIQQVLSWVMRLSDYGYEIRDEAILIGPKDKVQGQLVLRVYSVADLTRRKKNFYPPRSDDDADEDEEDEEGESSIALTEIIRKVVAPDSWDK